MVSGKGAGGGGGGVPVCDDKIKGETSKTSKSQTYSTFAHVIKRTESFVK